MVGGEQESVLLLPELNVCAWKKFWSCSPTRGGSEEEREDLLNQGLVDYGSYNFQGDGAEAPPAEKVVDSTVERDLDPLLSALADHARSLENEESLPQQGSRTTTKCSTPPGRSSALQFMDPVAYYNSLHQNAHLDPIASAKRGGTGEIC